MDFSRFEDVFTNAKKKKDENRKKYNFYSLLSTLFAVAAPILIAQTSYFIIRLIGAVLLVINYIITKKMDEYFIEWLGNQRYYNFLRLEFFEYRTGLDNYKGLSAEQKKQKVEKQLEAIKKDSDRFKEVMDLGSKDMKENINQIKSKLNKVADDLKNLARSLPEKYAGIVSAARLSYYLQSRYLDQLLWYYKRINPNEEDLKPNDVKKSVYFSFIKHYRISTIFKFVSIVLTVFTYDLLLELIGLPESELLVIILVLIATVCSIISSIYSELDKIQKNNENVINYLQTVHSLIQLYNIMYPQLNNEDLAEKDLNILQKSFTNQSERILLQENTKWSEIVHSTAE